jgi:nucleotidyltransferase/DNA polymerase involved in DNA repair
MQMKQTSPISCVLVTHLRTRLELARRPELADRAGVIVDRSADQAVVIDHLPAASSQTLGRNLRQALSIQPNAVVLEADEPHYRQTFEQMLGALEQVSDRVEGAELGVAYLGLGGLAAMHGGEAQLYDALLRSVPDHLEPHIGIAANKFTSFVAARVRRSSGVTTVSRAPAAFLAPHSIGLLPSSSGLREELHQLGLDTLGDVAAQEAHALLDRFGHEGRRAWELANGIDERPLQPRAQMEPITETLSLPVESTTLELLQAAVETLLQRAYAQPRMQGRYAGTATLACELEDAPAWERAFHFKNRAGHWRRAAEIIKARLETEHPRAPVEAMTLTLTNLGGAAGVQASFFPDLRHDREQRLLETERRLQARLNGKRSIRRLVEVAPWHPVPEQRTVQVSIDPSADDGMQPLTTPDSVAVREGPAREPHAVRIGERWREVTWIEDQWSFDLWWRQTPVTRSYYRVSQADGSQFTLFRDQREDRWYQQGVAA